MLDGFDEPAINLDDLLAYYVNWTGRQLIYDNQLQADGLFKVIIRDRITPERAAQIVEATLLLNGVAIVPTSTVNTFKVMNTGSVIAESPTVISEVEDLPTGDEVVHFVMNFKNVTPIEAAEALAELVPLHPYGKISALSDSLVVTENVATIRGMIELQEFIDKPAAEIGKKWVQLVRADVQRVSEAMLDIVNQRNQASRTARTGQPAAAAPAAPRPPGSPAVSSQSVSDSESVRIIPDTRTNRILIFGRPVDIAFLEGLIEDFDVESGVRTKFLHKLSFMPVLDFLPVAETALSRDLEVVTAGGAAGGAGARSTGTTGQRTSNLQANRNTGGLNQGNTGNLTGGGSLGGGGSLLGNSQALSAPESLLVGRTLLIADPQSNTLIVSGPPEYMGVIEDLIDEMDKPQPSIYLSTVIGQLTLSDDMSFGMDYLLTLGDFEINDNRGQGAGQLNNTGGVIQDIDLLDTIGNFPTASGLSLYGKFGQDLNATLRAFAQNTNFEILSRPTIYTKNSHPAVISSGRRVPVPTSQLTSVNTGVGQSVTSNIDYRDVVLRLEVSPLINNDDTVTLDIIQVNDTIVGSQVIGTDSIPIIGTQELQTTVTVNNNSTLVLGGLISETTSNDASGVPFLSKIPVLKHLFGQTTKSTDREELLIFIQPKIVNDHSDLIDANRDMSHRSDISNKVYEFSEPRSTEFRRANQAAGTIESDATVTKKKSFFAWPKANQNGGDAGGGSGPRKGYRNR